MTKYESSHISFEIPENWVVNFINVDPMLIYSVVAPSLREGYNFMIDINVEEPNMYMANLDFEALIRIHEEEPSNLHYETVSTSLLDHKSGEKIFFILQKHISEPTYPLKMSFFMPFANTNATYSIISGYNQIDAESYAKYEKEILHLIHSIEVK